MNEDNADNGFELSCTDDLIGNDGIALMGAGAGEGYLSIDEAVEQLDTTDCCYISVSASGILLGLDYSDGWRTAYTCHENTGWNVPVVLLTNYFDTARHDVGIELSPHRPLMPTSEQLATMSDVLRKVHANVLYVTVATPDDNIDTNISDPSVHGIRSAVAKVLQEYASKYPTVD